MNWFNGNGQIQAQDLNEAMQIVQKYASIISNNLPANYGMAGQPSMSDEARDQLLARAMYTQDGKLALAQTMANPIRKNLDYQGMGRRALVVDPLTNGAYPTYERDIDVAAVVVSSNGSMPESRVFGDRITVPTFTIASNPTVRISEVRMRRFNIIDRAVQKARQEIMAQEDANLFAALDAASTVENEAVDIADTGMRRRDLALLKTQVDHWDLWTTKFFMNINEFNDILLWGAGGGQGTSGGDFDMVTMREVMQTGLLGKLWNADIFVSKIVPPGTVYACADPEFLGVMPIRQDIEVLPADEPRQLKLGWVVSEEIGVCLPNPRAVAKAYKGYLVG